MRTSILYAFTALVFLLPVALPVHAFDTFTVTDIRVDGANRLEVGTVLNYLPVRVGESLSAADAQRAIRALYETGLFRDVSLARDGSTLVVEVLERPAVSEVNLDGDFSIDEEVLLDSLERIGLARGRIFDRSIFAQIGQVIRNEMYSRGKYGMQLETEVRDLDRNRVAVDITLREGKTARIREISIIGNKSFSDAELKDLMESGIPSPLALWGSADEYSRTKLEGDLEAIRSHYLNRGFANFSISSSQVTITPDRKEIYISINLDEGERFTFGSVEITGELPLPREELQGLVAIERGAVFSRQQIVATRTAVADRLAEEGYAFANINVIPTTDEESRTVDIEFSVAPGKKVYVRRISFTGHVSTEDIVYRREMRQFEGGQYTPSAVDRSKVRLQRLSQVQQVQVTTDRVPGTDDQVDVTFDIIERPTGSFSVGAGVSSSQGFIVNAAFEQKNLLGTGRDLKLSADSSEDNRRFILRYTNPYYTEWGVSRSLRMEYEEADPDDFDTRDYFFDRAAIGFDYSIPISEFTNVGLGFRVEEQKFQTTSETPSEVESFLDQRGTDFQWLRANAGFSYDTRNRGIFADDGVFHSISANMSLPEGDLEFYKLGYDFEWYQKLGDAITFAPRFDVDWGDGYGDDDSLPFFQRFFAGGIRSVRGYEAGSLGPRFDDGDPAGGDFRTVGTFEFVFPPPFAPESANTRLSVYYDFGTVFADVEDYDPGEYRTSLGVSYNWRSPIGPLSFSYARPLNEEAGDETQRFQFTIGTLF